MRSKLDASEARVRELERQQRHLVERVRSETAEKAKAESQTRKYRKCPERKFALSGSYARVHMLLQGNTSRSSSKPRSRTGERVQMLRVLPEKARRSAEARRERKC